jgi:segregation and condensation protein B
MTDHQAAPAASPDDGFDVDPSTMTGPIEALLFMATEPMSTAELAQALDVPKPVVWEALDQLRTFYAETGRGFELRQVGAGWRYYTRVEHHDVIARWLLEGQHGRLSQAALETLAVVAYLQPISRSRVSAVRAVNVDGVIRTLVTRELIEEEGRDPETGAMLFRTTPYFLERMGLTDLDELPPIAPHLPEASALEAELSGLAALSELGEDSAMPENASPASQSTQDAE